MVLFGDGADALQADSFSCAAAFMGKQSAFAIMKAAVKAVEALDHCLDRLMTAVEKTGSQCLITADHGNAENMLDEEGQPHTQHTTGPVPLVYVGPKKLRLLPDGKLSDIAPSLLKLMDLPQPPEMTGTSLVELI